MEVEQLRQERMQGVKLSPDVMAQLDQLGADENAVLVPAEILDRLREQR